MRENDEVSNPVIVNCKLKIKFKEAKCLKKNPITLISCFLKKDGLQ